MTRKMIIFVTLLFLIVAASVSFAIWRFGAEKVAAFGTAMSFVAAAMAAIVATLYMVQTSQLVRSTAESSHQQARTADLMLADLRFRVAPYLKFVNTGGPFNNLSCVIVNTGRGVATDVMGYVLFSDTNRQQKLHLQTLLDTNEEFPFKISKTANETTFTITFTCGDSAGLAEYEFVWSEARMLGGAKSITKTGRT